MESSSLERDSRLHVPRVTTQKPGVVEGIEYFVAPEFRHTYASNPEHLEKVGGGGALSVRKLRGS